MQDWQHQLYQGTQQQPDKPLYRLLSRHGKLERQLSYNEVWQQANGMAQVLQNTFKKGDRLLLLFEPDLDFCLALWACFLAGMVAIPLYPPADPRTRERFLDVSKDAEAAGILTTDSIHKKVRLARWFLPVFRRLKWLAIDTLELPEPQLLETVPAEALALLQYTSGSTDKPKGVMLTHQNFMNNSYMLDMASRSSGRIPEERCVSWLPLYHDMGLMSGVIQPVYFGTESVLLSPLTFLQRPLRWLQAISEYRGTYAAAPNFAYDFCVKRIREEQKQDLDLSSWIFALNGAEPIRAETLQRFAEAFSGCGFQPRAFFPAYGLAESTVFVAGVLSEKAPATLWVKPDSLIKGTVEVCFNDHSDALGMVSVGSTCCGAKYAIVEPETHQRLPECVVGEVWLQGDSVGKGYWKQPQLTAQMFEATLANASVDGATDDSIEKTAKKWLRTGDLGFVYKGQLYITGRRKDLIILHGENHYPQRFERIAEQAHPGFRMGCNAAFGVNVELEEKVVLVQEVRQGTQVTPQDMKQAVQEAVSQATRIPLYEVVLVQAGQIPKTSSGKVRRKETCLRYQKGKLKLWKT